MIVNKCERKLHLMEKYFEYIIYDNNIDDVIEFCKEDEDIRFLLGDGSSDPSYLINGGSKGTLINGDCIMRNVFYDTIIISKCDFMNMYEDVDEFDIYKDR